MNLSATAVLNKFNENIVETLKSEITFQGIALADRPSSLVNPPVSYECLQSTHVFQQPVHHSANSKLKRLLDITGAEIVNLDLDYQHKWSVSYDISLIVRTLMVVASKQGAY